ncbi:MAG TPA: type VI secretion system tube protein Hcp [Thermoanaerobaculia bacterium]
MRKAVLAAVLFLASSTVFADICFNLTGVNGDAPCVSGFQYIKIDLTPNSITVVKPVDKASPTLFLDCASGKHLQEGTVAPAANESIIIKDVTISSWSQSGDGNGNVQETVSFNFSKIEYASGGTKTAVSFIGTARAGTMRTVAVMDQNGQSAGKVRHFQISVRPGGSAVTSVELVPAVTPSPMVKAGTLNNRTVATAPQPHMSSGFLQIGGAGGTSMRFQLNGGTLVNGNLRANAVISPR